MTAVWTYSDDRAFPLWTRPATHGGLHCPYPSNLQ